MNWHWLIQLCCIIYLFIHSFIVFLGMHLWLWKFPEEGSNQSCSDGTRMQVQSLASLSKLQIRHCRDAATEVADAARIGYCCGCNVGRQPSLGTSRCHGFGPKKTEKKRNADVQAPLQSY